MGGEWVGGWGVGVDEWVVVIDEWGGGGGLLKRDR